MKVPWTQSRASVTSGIVVLRRPPKRIASIGTPRGSSYSGAQDRALLDRRAVAAVRVAGRAPRMSGVQGSPFHEVAWAGGFSRPSHQTSPSSVSATLVNTELPLLMVLHRVGVGVLVGAGRDAEEAVLRVDRPQPAVVADPHPGDVVADGLDLPAGDGRLEHREVGLAAGARERGGDVLGDALGAGQLEDQHVLGHPALVARHRAGDAEGVALLAEQRVAAVARSRRTRSSAPRGTGRCTWCRCTARRRPAWPWLERHADGVQRRHERRASSSSILRSTLVPMRAITRIERDDVRRVGDLHAEHRVLGLEVAHHERDDVHRPALHAARVELAHDGLHLVRVHPVVGGPAVLLVDRADVGAVLDARHVGGVGGRVERVRLLRLGRGG